KRIRYDKSPFDSTTPNEIYEMYELSKNKKSKDISENSVNLDSTKLLKKTKMKDKDKTLFD
ncbi:MAG: hypothetical protein C0174_00400, partial [Thermodesulfobium narugense]